MLHFTLMNPATLEERIALCEQKFNELVEQRQEIDTEMTKLQGEWRVLKELQDTPPDANTITAIAAKENE